MPVPQLLILWSLVVVVMILDALRQGKKFGVELLGLSILTATLITGLAVIYPETKPLTLWGALVGWLRNFLIYTILLSLFTKSSFKKSTLSGIVFASLLALLDFLA